MHPPLQTADLDTVTDMKKYMNRTPQEAGKLFEDEFHAELKILQNLARVDFMRLYDTHAAGSYLPAQHADFILQTPGLGARLVELKSSRTVSTLASDINLISKSQFAKMFTWERAGGRSIVLFLDQTTGAVEYWDGNSVHAAKKDSRHLGSPGKLLGSVKEAAMYLVYSLSGDENHGTQP